MTLNSIFEFLQVLALITMLYSIDLVSEAWNRNCTILILGKINAYHQDCVQRETGSVFVHPRHARMEHGFVSSPLCIVIIHYRKSWVHVLAADPLSIGSMCFFKK